MAQAQPTLQTAADRSRRGVSSHQSRQEVSEILKKASYLAIFSKPDPGNPPIASPLVSFIPQAIYAIEVIEEPHQLRLVVEARSGECGFRSRKRVGKPVAHMHLRLSVIPNNYQPNYTQVTRGQTPLPTLLLPIVSQRFMMNQGDFQFFDDRGSGFHGFAAGRFIPANVAGTSQLRVTGVVDIVEGLGQLQGAIGNIAINGYTIPPSLFNVNFIIRIVDLEGRFRSTGPLPPIQEPIPDPDPTTAFIPLMAELDRPIVIEPAADGKKRVHLVERLRLVDTFIDVGPGFIKSWTEEREPVGMRRTTLVFDPDDPNEVIPVFTENSEFVFFGADRKRIGTLQADLLEGRAFRTSLPVLERPFFRLAGFGPFLDGTGQFTSPVGMVTVNGALSLESEVFTAMYMLRISDPLGRFQAGTP